MLQAEECCHKAVFGAKQRFGVVEVPGASAAAHSRSLHLLIAVPSGAAVAVLADKVAALVQTLLTSVWDLEYLQKMLLRSHIRMMTHHALALGPLLVGAYFLEPWKLGSGGLAQHHREKLWSRVVRRARARRRIGFVRGIILPGIAARRY